MEALLPHRGKDRNKDAHFRSSSYPNSLMSNIHRQFESANVPTRTARSDTSSNPPTAHSSPKLSPASSPNLLPKKWILGPRSRSPSVEQLSGPLSTSPPSDRSSLKVDHGGSLLDRIKARPRPWVSSPKKQTLVSKEQTEGYHRTRLRVVKAISPMLDISGDITYEVLLRGAELLKFAPLPGLEGAAKVLLGIWETLQQIETNRLACLRLTERCADILIAIHEEILRAGKNVRRELREPLANLERILEQIQTMMRNQIHQTFYRRYFKRDEMLTEIAECNMMLQDCLGHFDRSIQVRILKFVMGMTESPMSGAKLELFATELDDLGLGIQTLPNTASTNEIHETIRRIQDEQNERDRSSDIADFDQIYGGSSAAHMHEIEKAEIPEAITALLRNLERLRAINAFDKLTTARQISSSRSSTWPLSQVQARSLRLRDQEMIERELHALKEVYRGPLPALPNWTITKHEIDLGEMVGRGFFSTVYKSKWGHRMVAIKVLELHTTKELFVNEINVWKGLEHRNVLELYGASSAEGPQPWFLVSPFMKSGSATDYLKRAEWEARRYKEVGDIESATKVMEKVDFLRMIHDVASGMKYLHEHGIYHGDLKAANVLVADNLRCIVADFGQSKWKVDVKHGNPIPNHAIRWQAPELMSGHSLLTKKTDIYAFTMFCVEIVTMGSIPWPVMNDDSVKHHVLHEEGRPPYPVDRINALEIEHLLHAGWHSSPSERPSFDSLVTSLAVVRARVTVTGHVSSPRITISEPKSLYDLAQFSPHSEFASPTVEDYHETSPTSPGIEYSTPFVTVIPQSEIELETSFDENDDDHRPPHILQDSLLLFDSDSHLPHDAINDGETVRGFQDNSEDIFEFTYRICLSHDFPRSLNIPLWTPGEAVLGDVGYLTVSGEFVTLFNALNPDHHLKDIRSLSAFGQVSVVNRQQKEKSFVQKGIRAFSKLMSPGEAMSQGIKRRHTFSLSGERTAFLCAEKTLYRYFQDSRASKLWFRSSWQAILQEFGIIHGLQKDSLMLIVETLTAQNYALFVNHGHIEGPAFFDEFTSPISEEPWGAFTLPPIEQDAPSRILHSKVSMGGDPAKTVLVARLRFQPDVEDPTLRI